MMRRTPMKRTGFQRSTGNNAGPRHITEIFAGDEFARSTDDARLDAMRRHIIAAVDGAFGGRPAPHAIVQTPKREYIRDEGYRRLVASHACFRCGRAGASQAAHSNSDKHGKGLSIKASDEALFPLCVTDLGGIGCHEMHDQAKDGLTRQQRRDQEVEWIALMAEIAGRAAR